MKSHLQGIYGRIPITVVVALIGMLAIGATFFYRASKLRPTKANGAVAPQQKMHELASARNIWSSYLFETNIRHVTVLKAIDDNVALAAQDKGVPPLTPLQIAAAREVALSFLVGYSSTSEEDFLKYRLPVATYTTLPSRVGYMRSTLHTYGDVPQSEIPSDPKELFIFFWNKAIWTGKPYITAVAPETLRFGFSRDTSSPMANDVRVLLPSVPTTGFVTLAPYFQFPGQPESVFGSKVGAALSNPGPRKIDGDLVTMTMICVIKPEPPDFPIPIISKLYWSDQYHRWLPYGLALGMSSQRKKGPLF